MELIPIGRTDPFLHHLGHGAMCKPEDTCSEAEMLSRKYNADKIYVVHYTGFDWLYVPLQRGEKMPVDAHGKPYNQRK